MSANLSRIQELELLSALESRAESPVKFAYMGDGYQRWIDIANRSRSEKSVQFDEDELKKESLPFILRKVTSDTTGVNIVDFGCGDGVPMLPVFAALSQVSKICYIPVDISAEMIECAKKTVAQAAPHVEVEPILFDFEKSEILEQVLHRTQAPGVRNFFFLLGNTLGNFDNTEKVLANLKLSMFPEDMLIIGNQVSNLLASQKLIAYYRAAEIFPFATSVLRQYGLECSPEEMDVRWNAKKKQIEIFLVCAADKQLQIAGHTVHFEAGEEILLVISRKFAEENIVEVFGSVGFRIDLFTTNKQKSTCIVSVSPTRYKS
jgi:uncharacterized SAM-dependent methyltransferase